MTVSRQNSPLVPDFDILINGRAISVEEESHIIEVTVDRDLHLPSMFTLNISGSSTRRDNFDWIDNTQLFTIGYSVEIRLGYADDLATVLIGEITGLEPEFSRERPPSLILRGYDRRHRLQRGQKTRTFSKRKDSDIATQIANEAQLTPQVQDSQVVHEYVIQANQTDWEFLQGRACLIQYDLLVEDKTLIFKPVANAQSKIATLTLEQDLLDFYPRLSSMGQISEVAVQGWSIKDKKAVIGRAKTGDEVSKMGGEKSGAATVEKAFGTAATRIIDRPTLTQAEADQLAKAQFNQTVLGLITGEGMCLGRTDLQPGKVIKIDGLGKRFSGLYYLTNVTHRYQSERGYYTHFKVRRNAV